MDKVGPYNINTPYLRYMSLPCLLHLRWIILWRLHFSNKRVLLSVLDFHCEAKQLLMFLLRSYCVVTGCKQDRKEAQQQQHFVCYFHSWWMMTVRVLNRFMYYTRMGHYIGACRIIDRFRQRTAGVSGALLQAYGVDLCRSKNGDYHSTAERSSYNTSRFALATGVAFVLGSAG